MSIKEHQDKGYDRHVAMFSPDGYLLQVEYAEKAVKLGSSVLGITTKDGVIYIADKRIKSKLIVKNSFRKVFEVDEFIMVSGAGVMSDGRRLIEESQKIAQNNKTTYGTQIDVLALTKDISNVQQYYSQSGGLRPFGVSLLISSYEDNQFHLYQTTPSGVYIKFLAQCVGNLSDEINKKLEERYDKNMDLNKAIKFGLDLFKENQKEEYDIEKFDIYTLTKKGIEKIENSKFK